MFNQYQRHKHASSVGKFALSDARKMSELGALASDSAFLASVETAVKNPTGPEAKEVMKTMGPLIRTTGKHTEFSPVARAHAITTLYAMVQYYQCPSVFLTISPDDVHSVLSIRLSIPSASQNGNTAFPAHDEGLIEQLLKGATSFPIGEVDISEFGLQKLVAENPVAATEIFKLTLEAVYKTLTLLQK